MQQGSRRCASLLDKASQRTSEHMVCAPEGYPPIKEESHIPKACFGNESVFIKGKNGAEKNQRAPESDKKEAIIIKGKSEGRRVSKQILQPPLTAEAVCCGKASSTGIAPTANKNIIIRLNNSIAPFFKITLYFLYHLMVCQRRISRKKTPYSVLGKAF